MLPLDSMCPATDPWKTLSEIAFGILVVGIFWPCGALLEYYVFKDRSIVNAIIYGMFWGLLVLVLCVCFVFIGYAIAISMVPIPPETCPVSRTSPPPLNLDA
jgi:hypothetical protein